jgi:hypothetical protein
MEVLINIFHRISENNGALFAIIGFFLSIPLIIFVWNFFIHRNKIRRGLLFQWGGGSAANPLHKYWLDGHRWTEHHVLKNYSDDNKKLDLPLKLGNFRFFDDYVKESRMPNYIRKQIEKTEIYIDARNTSRTVVVIGSAGSGKTEYIIKIISQPFYKKSVIFSKKGDFEKYLYRPSIDILLNVKLEEGSIHNFLDESVEHIMLYINTLMADAIGEKKDFFSGKAKQKLQNFAQRVKILDNDEKLTVGKKYELFIEFYEKAVEEAASSSQRSEGDIISTVEATMNLLYIAAYRILNGARTFTVKDFFESPDNIRLFLSSPDDEMDAMMAATGAVLIKYQLSLPDIKEWNPNFLCAWFLDEYLSFARVVDDKLLNEISEVGRSKGFSVWKLIQALSSEEKERKQITSNYQYLIIFSATEKETTIKSTLEIIGKTVYEGMKVTETYSNSGKSTTYSLDEIQKTLVTQYQINILQKECFSHIVFSPKEGILYKGYESPSNLQQRKYIDFKTTYNDVEFYRWKIEKEDALKAKKDAIQNVAKIAK